MSFREVLMLKITNGVDVYINKCFLINIPRAKSLYSAQERSVGGRDMSPPPSWGGANGMPLKGKMRKLSVTLFAPLPLANHTLRP